LARLRNLRGLLTGLLSALGAQLVSGEVAADAPAEPTRAALEYEAPEDCPTQTDFEHHIAQRTQRLRFVNDSGVSIRYKVVLARNAKGLFTGRLISGGPGAAKVEPIQGQSCADVVAALSLNLALLVDPDAVLDVPSQPPAPLPPPPKKEELHPLPVEPPPTALRWLVLAEWVVRGAMGQDASVGGGLATEYWGNRYGAFAPVIRLGASYSLSTREISGADVSFRLLQVSPALCPLRLGSGTLRWLPLCGAFEMGTIQVSSAGLARTALTRRIWTAGRASTAVALMGTHGAVEIAGGIMAPLRRYDFVFEDPTTLVYTTPAVGAYASVSVGVSF
jgi:hypothetical protein